MKENFNGHNPTPEDNINMDNLLKEVGGILGEASKTPKEEIGKKLLDNKKDFLINTEKGSTFELLVEAIIEELPDSGISITEESPDKDLSKEYVSIKATPSKTNREFIYNLMQNPIYKIIDEPLRNNPKGKEMETQGLLPKGITDRLASKYYHYKADTSPTQGSKEVWLNYLTNEVGNASPCTNEELKELFKKIIKNENNRKFEL